MSQYCFHIDIALKLERYARAMRLSVTADDIVSGEFIDTMICIIKLLYSHRDDYAAFCEKCAYFDGIKPSEMDEVNATELFNDFERLYNNALMKKERD